MSCIGRSVKLVTAAAVAAIVPLAVSTPAGAAPLPPLYRCPTGFVCIYDGPNPNSASIIGRYRDLTLLAQDFSRAIPNFSVVNARGTGAARLEVATKPPYGNGRSNYWCVLPRKAVASTQYVAKSVQILGRDSCGY